MGQAAVDLPTSDQQAPAPPGSADDLLSQLAGQEIDRLLAESDTSAEPQQQTQEATQEQIPAPHAADIPPEQLEKLLDPNRVEAELKTTPPAAATPATGEQAIQAQIDDLFKQLNADKAPPAEAAPAPIPASESAATAPSAGSPITAESAAAAAPVTVTEQPTTAAERAALHPAPEATPQLEKVLDDLPAAKPAFIVRVLELINRPFQSCPDTVRDTLGKVAILTLMNSVGVLMYLMMFRR